MDTLPDHILYPFLDQVTDIRADLGRTIPGDTGYFAKIDAALVYCIPHFVLKYVRGEDPAKMRYAKAHKAVLGLILYDLQDAELQNALSRLVDYLHARPSSFDVIEWLAHFLFTKLDPLTAAPLDLEIGACLVELSRLAGAP